MTTVKAIALLAALVVAGASVATLAISIRVENTREFSGLDMPETVDLGPRRYGEIAHYAILLDNTHSARPVRVDSLTSSCSCTSTAQTPLTLDAGKQTTIEGAYALRSYAFDLNYPSMPGEPATELSTTTVTLAAGADRRDISLVATLVAPFVPEPSDRQGQRVFSIHPLYEGRCTNIAFFLPGVSDPLKTVRAQDAENRAIYTVEAGGSSETIEAVADISGDSNGNTDPIRFVQLFPITHPESVGESE